MQIGISKELKQIGLLTDSECKEIIDSFTHSYEENIIKEQSK